MSEEKMYAVKNDEGEYWDFEDRDGFWELRRVSCPTTAEEKDAKDVIHGHGGHVVTFVEEPEKVVLTKEQAEIVENARDEKYPADYISGNSGLGASGEEKLLMNAYVNGYTVAKEKKYNIKVPHTEDVWYYKAWDGKLRAFFQLDKRLQVTFTESEIEHYGLQDCEKEEVTDDAD